VRHPRQFVSQWHFSLYFRQNEYDLRLLLACRIIMMNNKINVLEHLTQVHSIPVNGTVQLTGTSRLNLLTGLPLTGLLVNRTPCCPEIKFCVLSSR
jgi:hypothetical protein